MKTFKITWKKHGNVSTYDKEETISAVSPKMALKKFFNKKAYDGHTTRWWMDYDREVNGIYCTDFQVRDEQGIVLLAHA